MRKVQRVARVQAFLDDVPGVLLAGIGQQIHDNGALLGRRLNGKQRLAGHPAVALGQLPAWAALAQADDNVGDAVIAHVEALRAALHAIADDGERVILEDGLVLGRRVVAAGRLGVEGWGSRVK